MVYEIGDISPQRRQRMWRLLFLLGGGHEPAIRVLQHILRDQRPPTNPVSLDAVHLDRLVLQHIRDALGSDPISLTERRDIADPGAALLHTLHRLRRQSLEAWVLSRLEGADDVHVARAMDCSKTAARTFLVTADELVNRHVDDERAASRRLRDISLELDADRAFEEASDRSGLASRRRFARRTLPRIVAGLFIITLALHYLP